jgi:hypothetical protein
MTAEALAIVFGPNLLRPPENDFTLILANMGYVHQFVKALIIHVCNLANSVYTCTLTPFTSTTSFSTMLIWNPRLTIAKMMSILVYTKRKSLHYRLFLLARRKVFDDFKNSHGLVPTTHLNIFLSLLHAFNGHIPSPFIPV